MFSKRILASGALPAAASPKTISTILVRTATLRLAASALAPVFTSFGLPGTVQYTSYIHSLLWPLGVFPVLETTPSRVVALIGAATVRERSFPPCQGWP